LSHDHFNQLCSNEGKIVSAQVVPHEEEETLPECDVPLLRSKRPSHKQARIQGGQLPLPNSERCAKIFLVT